MFQSMLRSPDKQARLQGCQLAARALTAEAKTEVELAIIRETEAGVLSELKETLEQLRGSLGRELSPGVLDVLRRSATPAPAGRLAAVVNALRRLGCFALGSELSRMLDLSLAPVDLAALVRFLPEAEPTFDPARLLAYVRHRDDRVRANAVEAFAALTGPPPRELLECLDDPHPRVRAAAVLALARSHPREARACAESLASSALPDEQAAGTFALARLSAATGPVPSRGRADVAHPVESMPAPQVPKVLSPWTSPASAPENGGIPGRFGLE